MTYVSIPKDCLVLVCDGAKAVFYRNTGTALDIALVATSVLAEPHPPTRDLGSDEPGRVYESVGSVRSAIEEPDLHRLEEERFLKKVAAHLEEVVAAHRTASLVLIAAPRALGVLREALTEPVRRLDKAEIAKDLVKTPKPKLEAYLQSLGQ
jgi:protein required for attachment to host cells